MYVCLSTTIAEMFCAFFTGKRLVTFPMKLILSVLYLHETVIGDLEFQIPFGNETGTLKV